MYKSKSGSLYFAHLCLAVRCRLEIFPIPASAVAPSIDPPAVNFVFVNGTGKFYQVTGSRTVGSEWGCARQEAVGRAEREREEK